MRWLLLINNHDGLDTVKIGDYLPTCDWGKIIITSRRPGIQTLGCPLAVVEMEKEAGLAMLLKAMPTGGEDWTTEGEVIGASPQFFANRVDRNKRPRRK